MKSKALAMLEEHEIKASYQRLTILEYLMEDHSHPTADNVYTALTGKVPVISRATVYNTLALFLEKGIVSTMISARNELRYDLVTQPHGHFICEKCEQIYNFPYHDDNLYESLDGFQISSEEIVLRGICRECLIKNN